MPGKVFKIYFRFGCNGMCTQRCGGGEKVHTYSFRVKQDQLDQVGRERDMDMDTNKTEHENKTKKTETKKRRTRVV